MTLKGGIAALLLAGLPAAACISSAFAADDPQAFIRESLARLKQQQSEQEKAWGFRKESSWRLDQGAREISFYFADGKVARAPVQVVGTYNPRDRSFVWAWDHPSFREPLREHAYLAKAWGEMHDLAKWTTGKVQCTEKEAWEFTAVAARLGKARGAYRGPSNGPLVFVTFGEVKLGKKKKEEE